MSDRLDVSVVVPTRDRPDLLFRCLEALTRQTIGPDDYEVIVVDDGGRSQATRRIVEAHAISSRVPVRYLRHDSSRGPAAARNTGWQAARGDIIAFTDDDTVPDIHWLERGLAAMDGGGAQAERITLAGAPADTPHREADGVMGRIVVPLSREPTDHELDTAGLETAEFATANVFYRRDALDRIGGFDERFRAAWREDADVFFTLLEEGAELRRASDAVVVHPARPARWGSSLRQQRKTQYNALLLGKHPELYRERIGRSPRWYYGAVGLLGVGVWGALTGRRRSSMFALAAWALVTAAFASKRLEHTSHHPRHVAEMLVTSAAIPPLSVYQRLKGAVKFRAPYF